MNLNIGTICSICLINNLKIIFTPSNNFIRFQSRISLGGHDMHNDFLCPKCNGQLNVGDVLIFVSKMNDENNGLLLLHPELGNYNVMNHKQFHISKGELVEFSCPICHKNLTSDIDNNLVFISMMDKDHVQHNVLFSKISGERCTYRITGDNLESFGEDSATYINKVKRSIEAT